MLQQLIRGVVGGAQQNPAHLLQALQQSLQQPAARPPPLLHAHSPVDHHHHRPNSRASLTGSGGAAPPPAVDTNTNLALAALQALLAKTTNQGGGAGMGTPMGPAAPPEGPPAAAPAKEDASPTQQSAQTDDVIRFLLNYVPPVAEALPSPSSQDEGPRVRQHVEHVAVLSAQDRPRTVAYLTHVMAPPTDASGVVLFCIYNTLVYLLVIPPPHSPTYSPTGNEQVTNAQWDMLYTVLTVTTDNVKAGDAPCQTLVYRCPADAKVYPHVAVACHLGLKNHLNKPQGTRGR